MNKNINVAVVILLVVSLWMNFMSLNRIENLNQDLNYMQHRLENEINSISNKVSSTLQAFKQESMWVRNYDCQVKNFSDDFKEAEIEIKISLNDKIKDEKLKIAAISEQNSFLFDVPENNNLTYTLTVTLPTDDYELKLLGETSTASRSSVMNTLYLNSYKKSIININGDILGGKYNHTNKEGSLDFYVKIDVMKKSEKIYSHFLNEFNIIDIKADVYVGTRYLDTIDLWNGKNYMRKDIEKLSNAIPESASEMFIRDERFESEQEYFYSGTYEYKSENENIQDLKLVVKVKDNKGNSYIEPIGLFTEEEYEILLNEKQE